MATITAIASGRWSADAATVWSSGAAPTSADDVVTPAATNLTSITIATSKFNLNAHGLLDNDPIVLGTSGALPTGVNTTTVYYVVNKTTNDFQLEASIGGGAITLSGSQSGTHSFNKRFTVTLDTTGLVCKTFNFGRGWKLAASTTASSEITAHGEMTMGAGSELSVDMSSVAYSCTFKCNGAGVTSAQPGITLTAGMVGAVLKGKERTRWTQINQGGGVAVSDESGVVDAATGWIAGDVLVFGTTQAYNATPRIDVVTLDTNYAGGTSLTWDNGFSGSGPLTYAHADNGYVGNFSSNVIITSNNISSSTTRGRGLISNVSALDVAGSRTIQDVLFSNLGPATFGQSAFKIVSASTSTSPSVWASLSRNAFYNTYESDIATSYQNGVYLPIDDNVFYSPNTSSWRYNFNMANSLLGDRDLNRNISFRTNAGQFVGWSGSGCNFVDAVVMAGSVSPLQQTAGAYVFTRLKSFAADYSLGYWLLGQIKFVDSTFGTEFSATNGSGVLRAGNASDGLFQNCSFQSTILYGGYLNTGGTPLERYFLQDKNGDSDSQELYQRAGYIYKDTTVVYNGLSSFRFEPKVVGGTFAYEFDVLVAAGDTLVLKGNTRRDTSTTTLTISAADAAGTAVGTPHTCSASVDTWQSFSISLANAGSVAKLITVTATCSDSASITAKAYLDGIPDYPFVNKVRWYGYNYDETTKTRTANAAITEATEATAYAYTGIAVGTGTAPALTGITLSSDHSFVEIYDYTQAWARANIAYNVPLTASVAGLLTAQCNVTTTGYQFSGAGSLLVGGYTLTADTPFSYTYTGGTFSQASTVPTFSGGTLNIGAAGTYTYAQAAAMILSMTPTAPGTYALGDTTFTGQVDLRNTSGSHAITVELPTGTSYTTANNTGAAITVTVPIVTADISITGMANTTGANNRLQIINQSAVAASDWQAATVYAAGDVVLRTSGVGSESTAGLYMRCTSGGTTGGSEPTWDTTVGNTTTDNTVIWTTYAVLYYDNDPAGTSLTDTYIDGEEFVAGETIEIRFAEEDPGVTFKTYATSVVATADGFSALVNETDDDVYATYGLSGAAYESTFSPNYVSSYIVLDANTDFSGKSAYAYYCYLLTTSQGMYRFWGGLTGIDAGNIRNNVGTISLYFDESAGFVKQTDDVRIFRSDNTRPAIDPTTGGSGIEINWRTPVSVVSTGGSALTPTESAQLMALPSASAIANQVVNGITFP